METDKTDSYVLDQLAVTLKHLPLVIQELSAVPRFKIDVSVSDRDPILGLALLDVAFQPGSYKSTDPDRLDVLLSGLYERCKKSYGQWVPTLGKNRLLKHIDGASGYVSGGGVTPASGYISGGGGGFPTDHAAYRPGRGRALGQHARVGILDTDLYPHPRLAGRYIADAGSLLGRNGTEPYHAGHATFVAGLVVQEAPGTELHIEAVLDRQDAVATAWQVARAMVKFIGSDIDVLNLSMGCFTADGEPPMVLQRAVELLTPDVVLVAAAGNHGKIRGPGFITPKSPFWPAALPDVVAVGAHDANGHRAGFSPQLPWIDLSAPGVDVVSTYLNGTVITDKSSSFAGYASWSGTSFAAATVTGAIAANIKPGRTARQSLQLLLDTPAPPAGEPNEAPSARPRARIWQFQE